MENHIYVHQIKFVEKDEFTKRFNHVSDLFSKATDETLPKEEQDKWWEEYFRCKLCLEQGYPF